MYEFPAVKPVTVVEAEFGFVIVAEPETMLQTPVPIVGEFAESVAEVTPQTV